jgi:hypothetical protein
MMENYHVTGTGKRWMKALFCKNCSYGFNSKENFKKSFSVRVPVVGEFFDAIRQPIFVGL